MVVTSMKPGTRRAAAYEILGKDFSLSCFCAVEERFFGGRVSCSSANP